MTSLICSLTQISLFFSRKELQTFGYTVYFYSITGAFIYSFFDTFYSWYALLLQEKLEKKVQIVICSIISYISVYGILLTISWITILMHVIKLAIIKKKKQQLAKHLSSAAFAFIVPILFTLFPIVLDMSIYGFYQPKLSSVCWLQYKDKDDSQGIVSEEYGNYILSILCFYSPILLCAIFQLYELYQIKKKLQQMISAKQIYKGHEPHIKILNSLFIFPIYSFITWTVPCIIYIIAIPSIYVTQIWVIQIFRTFQSLIGLVLLIISSQNEQLVDCFLQKDSCCKHRIDLFDPLEEFNKAEVSSSNSSVK
ncbi:hypothetical protein pb186bvf_009390 [Paramecium bursaria]